MYQNGKWQPGISMFKSSLEVIRIQPPIWTPFLTQMMFMIYDV